MFEEMSLNSLSFDMYTGEPLILLKDSTHTSTFIVNGSNQDVRYLMSEFSGTIADASSPYSLLLQIVDSLGARIERLEIVPAGNNTQRGHVFLKKNDQTAVQNCRPVDTVIIANKLSLPIFVSPELLNRVEMLSQIEDGAAGIFSGDLKNTDLCSSGGGNKEFLM